MNPSDYKFTLYDIVSYTFCGAISLILLNVVFEIKIITLPETEFSKYLLKLISLEDVVSFIVVSYFLGKIISALSSLIFEKIILDWAFKKFYKVKRIDTHISGNLYAYFNENFSRLYNKANYIEENWRILTTFVEEYRPASYSTAFIFLAYYGMSRNLMLIFLVFAHVLICSHLLLAFIFLAIFIVESYEYFRFRKYFYQQIIYAFLNKKEGE